MSAQSCKRLLLRVLLSLSVIALVLLLGNVGNVQIAQAQIVLDANADLAASVADVADAATAGTSISQLRTFTGNVDYAVIGNSFTSTELSCNNLGTRSASLNLPAGSSIEAAYLYWAGSGSLDSTVRLNGQTINAQQSWQESFVNGSVLMYYFGARADVTSQVTGSGSYAVSSLSYNTGSPYCSTYGTLGNWALVVVYENSSVTSQTVNLYDGFLGEFRGPNGSANSTTLTHYLPVNVPGSCSQSVRLTHVSHEGDSYKGEYLYINGSYKGDNTYNGSTAPNLDIDSYDITNLVGTGSSNISFQTQNYYTNGAQEAYINNVFVVKYRSCIVPTPTPTNTPAVPTPTNTPIVPTPTNTPNGGNTAALGDRVWNDTNGNGVQDIGEPSVSGVTVELLAGCSGDTVLATKTTSANGAYIFSGLAAGQYRVRFTLPSNFSGFSPKDAILDDDYDSDVNANGVTDCITLDNGEVNYRVDAGLISGGAPTPTNTPVGPTPTNTPVNPTPTNTPGGGNTAALGDFVWNDSNGNGVKDIGEPSVPGVTVELLAGCSGNTVIASRTTNTNGGYIFSGLAAGQYRVRFTLPSGFSGFSPKDAILDDNYDSDANPDGVTDCINLANGEENYTVDAGLVSGGGPTPTPTNTPVAQLGSLGDRVWNDLDRDGIQDAGETGVPGVTVQLKDCANNVLQSQQTDSNGNYSFNNLATGCYRIGIILPSGFQFSPQDQGGNDATDSDVNPATAMTGDINLAAGENNPTVDAGINQPAGPTPTNTPVGPTPTNTPGTGTGALGDFVWNDSNGNGVKDIGEPGVSGVTVELLAGCSGNTVIASRTTNANGGYIFSGLAAGQYRVRFTLPSGFSGFSPKDAILDDNYDSDANPDGVTDCITLANGEENYRVDAGLVSGGGPTPTPTNTPVGPTPTPTNTPVGPTATPTPQVGGPICYEGPCPDTDGDGIPDYLDEDDDNDGIPSVDEDANGNGNLEDDDSDGDGIPDYLDPLDSDNDTIPDIIEDVNRNGNLNDDDTDGDGTPNYLDTDSDNDGIPDKVEVGRVPSFPYDADRDGTPDYLDSDSDNDGESDAAEGVGSKDGDGIPDYLDPQDEGPGSGDSDGDGVPDAVECPPALLGSALPDLDQDGIPDYLDTDLILYLYLPSIQR